ncbi:uncharacterized protein LOC136025022 isoform X2 [Artemia franciscana]|uniref:uncharacterized protein LOC136025022 isoform X2 n=1 Tax=Artemia franciscana TaxID=6661 RepID=UPI0032DA5A27
MKSLNQRVLKKDNGIKLPKCFKDNGMMKLTIKASNLLPQDENLMQKNLKEFAAKDPGKALKYGIKFDCNKYHRTSMKGREDLDRDKSERKFFSNQKERDEKKRERGEKEKGTNLERKNLSWAVQRRSESTLVKCFFVENASELQLAALRSAIS